MLINSMYLFVMIKLGVCNWSLVLHSEIPNGNKNLSYLNKIGCTYDINCLTEVWMKDIEFAVDVLPDYSRYYNCQ